MKPDYKNWIPKVMLYTLPLLPFAAVSLLVVFLFFTEGTLRIVLSVFSVVALIASLKSAVWCICAYRAFSYDGKRRLSSAIIEGTASYIKLPEGGKALDVGCGSGALAIAVAKRNSRASVTGIDRWGKEYASYNLSLCMKNAEAEGVKNVTFQKGDAVHLCFPDESFDAVTSNYVYHNITGNNKQALLFETLRVLRKGGTFAIHDIMSPRRYGDMTAFVKKLYDMGYERVELIDTTKGLFMTRREAGFLMLRGSTLLVGTK